MSGIDIVIGLGGQQNTSMIVRHTKHIPIFLRKQFRNGHCTLACILELEEEMYGLMYYVNRLLSPSDKTSLTNKSFRSFHLMANDVVPFSVFVCKLLTTFS